ncbi:dynamin family protein [Paenibacillus timonensis]|nr:dynamin family protein [Paenibacillus timonensis]
MIVMLLPLLNPEELWSIFFYFGLIFLSVWCILCAIYIWLTLKGIINADEQTDNMWNFLYSIYFLFASYLRDFPYQWIELNWHISVNRIVITVTSSALAFVMIVTCLRAILRPYKQILSQVKRPHPVARTTVINLLASIEPSRRYASTVYIEAIIERLKERKKLFELIQNGTKYLVSKKTAAQYNLTTSVGGDPKHNSSYAFVAEGQEPMQSEVKETRQRGTDHSCGGIVDEERFLALLRQNFNEHPLQGKSMDMKRNYLLVLFDILESRQDYKPFLTILHQQYISLLGLNNQDNVEATVHMVEPANDRQLEAAFGVVKKRYVKVKGWKINSFTLKHALLGEYLFLGNALYGDAIKSQVGNLLAKRLRIRAADYGSIVAFCTALKEDELKLAQLLLLKFKPSLRAQLNHLYQRAVLTDKIVHRKRHRTAVIATMSAGKSTFINALAGLTLVPSKSQACTAMITTLLVNNEVGHCFGCVGNKEQRKTYEGILQSDTIEVWNQAGSGAIYVEGPIAGLTMDSVIPVFIDTPGTNYSQDPTHSQITYSFLEKREFDSIVYLINATQISTEDDIRLRKKIIEIWKEGGKSIIFLLNRIDEFDLEGDDNVAQSVDQLVKELRGQGVEQPKVIPISAYAAKLFRMAIAGLSMSKKEHKDYEAFCRLFIDDAVDLTSYVFPVESTAELPLIGGSDMTASVEKTYSNSQLELALERTGIKLVERIIADTANHQGGQQLHGSSIF